MVIALRIMKSIQVGDSVRVELSQRGIENPDAKIIVFDEADVPEYSKLIASKCGVHTYKTLERPSVVVNKVEMKLRHMVVMFGFMMVKSVTFTIDADKRNILLNEISERITTNFYDWYELDAQNLCVSMILDWE